MTTLLIRLARLVTNNMGASCTEHSYDYCRGIFTADVLELGLSRGAIAARKLEGVKRDKEHEGLYWFGPLR